MKNLVRHHHDGNILILRTNNLLKSPPLQANYCITLNHNTMKNKLTVITTEYII